jgi:hypothetical protein
MIYKFKDLEHPNYFIEFFECSFIKDSLSIQITSELKETIDVNLNKEQLFELIGGLLRIQSKMKGGSNG